MKNDTDTAALLPCPFCGGAAIYSFDDADNVLVEPYGHMHTCERCATTSGSSQSRTQAIAAWNRRATPPTTDAGEREAVARAIADGMGDDFDSAHADKGDWNATRGEKDGRFRDINEPMQPDYLYAADAALAYLAPIRAREIAAAEARAAAAERERDELKSTVLAFVAPWAAQYARDFGLPYGHLHPVHYDILQSCGARLDDFTRADIAPQPR